MQRRNDATTQRMKEFSIGFITDTHVGPTRESCARIEGAYKVFKREGCEVIVNAGDIADRFCPDGYRHYREIADATFPDLFRDIWCTENKRR